jgi:pilus assembly protein Flp/PilA
MLPPIHRVFAFIKREDGPTAVEYAVMLALIIIVCVSAILTIGNNIDETAETVTSAISTDSP